MPEFIANGILKHRGKVLFAGASLTLTEEQAERLGTKVTPKEVAQPAKTFDEMNVKELRATAKKAGIDKPTTLDRAELLAALGAIAPAAAVPAAPIEVEVKADEPASG